MCGIAGLFSFRGSLEEIKRRLSEGSRYLKHRGPDDEGFWIRSQLNGGLAHRRLSILDLSPAGHQPMTDSSGRWVVSLNGEIYNYKELRSTLEKNLKTQFVGSSDTEVVLEYVAAYGIRKALAEFKGMFAIAILDIQNRKLFLVRDRAGEKPVFYYIDESEIAFASELPALLKLVSTSPKICRHSLAQFLRFNFIPAPNTIYEGIKKLLPGQMLEISIESDRFLKQFDTYWSAETEFKQRQLRKSEDTYEDQLTRFATLFRDSVKGQLQADVPVGAFLSGGIDSSAVVVEMAKLSSQKIRTYTIGFVESEYDESPYARRLSEFLSTQHEHQILCAEDALAIVPHLSETFGEPFGDASAIPTMLVSKMASKSVKVALSGDGGDELFGGYPHYTTVGGVWPKISKFPHWSRSIIAELLPLVPTPGWRVAEVILKKIAGQQALRRPLSETWRGLQSLLISKDFREFYFRLIYSPLTSERILKTRADYAQDRFSSIGAPIEKQMMLFDLQCYLPDDILTKTDRSAMRYSLELRSPFLDKDIIEFSFSLPMASNFSGLVGKRLIRDHLKQQLPEHLFDRPKKGFCVPTGEWIRGPLKEWAQDLLSEGSVRDQGWLDASVVSEVFAEYLEGKTHQEQLLWNCLMFQSWLRDRGR